jgi:hypothetical protein
MPTVTLIGQSAVASAGNFRVFSSDWYAFYFENQKIVDSSATANKSLSGIESIATNSEILFSGGATNELTGIEATSQLGTSVISGTENVSVVISGIDIVSSLGDAIGQVSINVETSVTGIEATASVGSVTATQESAETWSSGQIKRYPANAFKNSSVKLSGIVAQSSQNDISALGTVKIDATVALNNVVSFSQVANINADGILSISDDEIILLMAA